jgi:DNA-binding IclR family transcriptional regulator
MKRRTNSPTITDGAQAIRRALDVVRAVAQAQRSGATLSRVAHGTGLSTSTTFRILRTLSEERLLRYDDADRCYYIGALAFELGLAALSEAQVQTQWRDAVDQVARQTRLTTYLMARSGSEAVCLLCVQGSTAIRAMPVDVGQRLPLGIGAGSLAILSTLDDEEVRQILSSHGSHLDLFPGGKPQAKQILERVELARRRGFSISSGTVAHGVTGIGLAIPQRDPLVQLAISVSAAARKIEPEEAKQLASIISAAVQSAGRDAAARQPARLAAGAR